MKVQLELPDDVAEKLTELARLKGNTLEQFLLEQLHLQPKDSLPFEERRRRRMEAFQWIEEFRKRVKPDPEGWTAVDYIRNGRR